MKSLTIHLCCILAILAISTLILAQSEDEFLVNTTTEGRQDEPAIAMDGVGNFVIIWHGNGVFAQRFDNLGTKVGNEFKVNTSFVSDGYRPRIAMDNAGNFAIVWSQDNDIYAQMYGSNGNPIGDNFRVSSTARYYYSKGKNGAYYPQWRLADVAMDADGNFVISWGGIEDPNFPTGAYAITYARMFDNNGNPRGNEFQTSNIPGIVVFIASDSSGNFVTTNQTNYQTTKNIYGINIYAQRWDSDGNKVGPEFQVNAVPDDVSFYYHAISMNDYGFIISWTSVSQDGSCYGIVAKRYDSNGNPVGDEFQVNTDTNNAKEWSSAALDSSGNFIISWDSNNQDGSSWGVYAQRYDYNGTPVGTEFQVNQYNKNGQYCPSVAMTSLEHYVITWSSYNQYSSQNGGPDSGNDIYARILNGDPPPTPPPTITATPTITPTPTKTPKGPK